MDAVSLFKNAMMHGKVYKYKKVGETAARKAKKGEKIHTIIDGKKELTAKAKDGDWVVTGPAKEEYLVPDAKFQTRYKGPNGKAKKKGFELYTPTGVCYAFKYTGDTGTFEHNRGEMLIETGDYLASTSTTDYSDVYRIEKKVFKKTYEKMELVSHNFKGVTK